jgi:putative serine protease PepD
MNRRSTRIAGLASALLLTAGLGAGGGAAIYASVAPSGTTTIVRQVPAGTNAAATSGSSSVGEVYEQTHEGVVEITVGAQGGPQAQGSGFVVDDEGHVVTNQHVVDGATSISVMFSNGESYDATLVGSDPSTDLAVIDVDAPASVLHPLDLGDSDALAVGDGVVALGSPFGLEGTLTTGVVSALHRQMTAPNGYAINDAIQTDAAINHGNSGGPLLSLDGEVVGVNAQIESESGGSDGVGFAIPSSTVKAIVAQLLADGSVSHAYLGVSLESTDAGVQVAEVRAGSPAASADLAAGDVITAVDGDAVSSPAELQVVVDAKQPGDTLAITYRRNGEEHTADVELGARPA